jgi:hypothetical protein
MPSKTYKILKTLNACFLINKNVKQKAYSHTEVDCQNWDCDDDCYRCNGTGRHEWTTVDYNLRDSMYADKEKIIKWAVAQIKKNKLPIKYGKKDGVIYFEFRFQGNPKLVFKKGVENKLPQKFQVSFHDPKENFPNLKKFKGNWTGIRNKAKPFSFVESLS